MLGPLSIVILGHNKADVSAICLRSLLNSAYRPLQLIFVNNGSTDWTKSLLSEFSGIAAEAGIQFDNIELARNRGTIVPRNLALSMCRGDWVALIDNDVFLRTRTAFEQLVGFLASHDDIGMVTPKLVYPAPPYRIQCAGGGITREGHTYLIGRGEDRGHPEFNFPRLVPWCLSACMVMPTAVIRMLGPLDETFNPITFEDTDYCFRLRARGKGIIYLPSVEMYHVENTTTFGTREVNILKATQRNQRIFLKRWRHMFPSEPSTADLPLAHVRGPHVALWEIHDLPII